MAPEAYWGLDIGQNALKAVKARRVGDLVEVLAFEHIEYREPPSGGDNSAAIREVLQTFLSRNDIENTGFAVSIAAGRSALIRFIKLPPVDRRKVPDIVRYEATQQIPFPLEDVIWDYQLVEREYEPGEELEVGIFAMRREAIFSFLSNLMVTGIEVDNIQLSAAAVYNCIRYDSSAIDGAILGVDIGAENTNLIIVDGNNVWTRSLPIGGNDFTRAVATKYGLEFEQAETLKRGMARSKKAQEIFEAIRPSLRSLMDEIQRSVGYYRSLHKGSKFAKLVGFGAGFKMFGVKRFMETGLAYPVEVFGRTNNISVNAALNLQLFKKSAPAFGAALGLVVQALGLGGLNTNLMPPQILRERLLKSKRPMLMGAAAMLAGAAVLYAGIAFLQPTAYSIDADPQVREINAATKVNKEYIELMKIGGVRKQLDAIVSRKASKADSLDAFKALVASIPADEEFPIYIRQMAMESGTAARVNLKLRKPAEKGRIGDTIIKGTPVPKEDTIDTADRDVGAGAKVKSKAAAEKALDDREAMRDRNWAANQVDRQQRQEKMAKRRAQKELTKSKAAGTKRREGGVSFPGVGFIAELWIETANPEGTPYIPKLCAKMKASKGVQHCDYYYVDQETFWENTETHARTANEPRGSNASQYEKKVYTVAVIQWVYSAPEETAAPKGGS